jgi:beta-galactosidase
MPFSKRLPLIAILLLPCFFAVAQQKKRLITDWEFLRQDLGGIWEAVRPVTKGSAESVPLWQPVNLPHCVNAEDAVDPDVNYYQGPSWYRTNLSVQNPYQNGRTILHFEGAGQKVKVYVYTTLVGEHVGGYDEFSIDITKAVETFAKHPAFQKQFKGKVPVSIRTDNSRDLEMIPSSLSDFNLYGGIYRYLNLVYLPAISADKIKADIQTDKTGQSGRISISSSLLTEQGVTTAPASIRLLDPAGKLIKEQKVELTTNAKSLVNWQINKPLTWSPDDPNLYTVELSMPDYVQTEKVAFRHFEFVNRGPFLLNGKRFLLKGTHRHEDHAGVGAAMTEEQMREEMIMMKEMGVNFIRLGHYQQSDIILNLCDSLGIMVWEEIPWCRGGLGGDVYKEQAKRMLKNMITQHYNHPSIIIWGMGNENDWPGDFETFDTLQIRAFMKELNDLSHQLDPSRKTAIRRCDFCKDIVDVYSPSIWAGWYRGIYTDYKKSSEIEMQKVNHFLHVEWGGDSHAGRHAENPDKGLKEITSTGKTDERAGDASLFGGAARVSKDGDWSESYICNLIDWHLKEQETMDWLTGTAQWPFKDFSTPLRPDNPVPYVNQKGVVARDFVKKESYYLFQSYWATKPMAHIYGHSWPVRWGTAGEEKMIKVYSNCDEAELFVNNTSYGIKKRNSQDFPAAGLRWSVPLDKGSYKVHVVARKGKEVVKDSIRFEYETAKWGKPSIVQLVQIASKGEIKTYEVKLLDEKGTICLDNTSWVRFGFAGKGKLIDKQGTPNGSGYVQLYNGRAVISVKAEKGVLSALVEGLSIALINL